IRARGIGEPVLFAPRPDRKPQAYEGGEEVRKVEVERPRSVTVAQRQGEVGPGAETLDLNRAGGRFRSAFTAARAATRSLSNANSSDRRRSRANFAWRGSLCGAAPVA